MTNPGCHPPRSLRHVDALESPNRRGHRKNFVAPIYFGVVGLHTNDATTIRT
jgi:hypothetical protein